MNALNTGITAMVLVMSLAAELSLAGATPLTTAFTYQGELKLVGSPLNSTADFVFTLYDDPSDTFQIGPTQQKNNVALTDGRFTVQLDSGANSFDLNNRWLEIAVRSPAGGGPFTTLTPRQQITPAPYALQTRGIFVNQLNQIGIGNTNPTAKVELTGDLRLSNDTNSIYFSDTDGANFAMMYMFQNAGNGPRMVLAHSEPFFDWGLQYDDSVDDFQFLSAGNVKLAIDLQQGDLSFSDDQASISFPAADAANAPMIHMFPGAGAATRMVLAHSPSFPNWGLQYQDAGDEFHFLGAGTPVMTIDLVNQRVGVGNANPANALSVTGSADVSGSLTVNTDIIGNDDGFFNDMLTVDGDADVGGTVFASQVVIGDPTCTNVGALCVKDDNVFGVARFDRISNDGVIVALAQAGGTEGTISVLGSIVSYNAFTGSHYGWTDQTIELGALVTLTGVNRRLRNDPDSEIIYGITPSTCPNDSKCLGAYLNLQMPSDLASADNPHLVMAVGNGEMWVAQSSAGDIQPGDYLISSEVPGCAMKDDPQRFPIGYIIARAAEGLDWFAIAPIDGRPKRAKISVLFHSFVRNSEAQRLAGVVRSQQDHIESLTQRIARLESLLDDSAAMRMAARRMRDEHHE